MESRIVSTERGSPAEKAGIMPGERLRSINSHVIEDVLDYKYYSYDARLELELAGEDGSVRRVVLHKPEGRDIGLNFEDYLMDSARSCRNKCVFCFIDQMPPGLRETLYFKDDDARLSFLQGNYITMTNLSERDIQRICQLRISPLGISVHATEPELRRRMLSNRFAGKGYEIMQRFAAAGIQMNCQIVVCPGLNDGEALQRTMNDLAALYPQVNSVSVVPVGLTKYREGLYPLTPCDSQTALEILKQVGGFGELCLERFGSRIFFCADELWLKAGLDLPPEGYYEDYPQLENGVGMLRLFEEEFKSALRLAEPGECSPEPCAIATGVAAAPFMQRLVDLAAASCDNVSCTVYAIKNDFFGHSIDVAGLVTGGDLIAQLRGKELGGRLLIPKSMTRHGEDVFLDDVRISDVERELGVRVVRVENDGAALFDEITGGGV